MMYDRTSSHGLEYLVSMMGLGFESCACQLCVILIVYYF